MQPIIPPRERGCHCGNFPFYSTHHIKRARGAIGEEIGVADVEAVIEFLKHAKDKLVRWSNLVRPIVLMCMVAGMRARTELVEKLMNRDWHRHLIGEKQGLSRLACTLGYDEIGRELLELDEGR